MAFHKLPIPYLPEPYRKNPEHYQYTSQPPIHTRVTTTGEPLFYVYGYVWVFPLILPFILS